MEVLMYILSLIGVITVIGLIALFVFCLYDYHKTRQIDLETLREYQNRPCYYGERMTFWMEEIERLNKETLKT